MTQTRTVSNSRGQLTTTKSAVTLPGMNMTTALRGAIEADGRALPVLAVASGTDKSQLSRFMRGERSVTLNTGDKLLAALGLECRLLRRRGGKSKGR